MRHFGNGDKRRAKRFWRRAYAQVVLTFAVVLTVAAPGAAAPSPGTVAPRGFADAAGSAGSLTAAGLDMAYAAAEATTEATDPAPTCAKGATMSGTLWLKVPATKNASSLRLNRLRAAVRADAGSLHVVVYGAAPIPGTELACWPIAAGSGVSSIDIVIQRSVDVWVLVAGAGAAPGPTGVGRFELSATKVQSLLPATARRDSAAAIARGGSLITMGGYQTSYLPGVPSGFHSDAVERLDIDTGKWSTIGTMPTGMSHGAAFATPAGIHLPGGRANVVQGAGCIRNTHLIFEPTKAVWSSGVPIPGQSRFDYAAVTDVKRARGFVLGGAFDPTPCDFGSNANDEQRLAEVWAYDDRSGWQPFAAMSVPRQGPAATLAGDVLVVAGGITTGGAVTGAVEAFDARQNRWVRIADLPVPVYGAVAVPGRAADGTTTLIVGGGWNAGAKGPVGVLQVLNFKTGRWSIDQRGALTPRESLYGAAVRGRLVTIGGVGTSQVLRLAERFTVDRYPPTFTVRRARTAAEGVSMRVRASDTDSGISSITWKLRGSRRVKAGAARTFGPAEVGKLVTVTVVDGAGNARRQVVRVR